MLQVLFFFNLRIRVLKKMSSIDSDPTVSKDSNDHSNDARTLKDKLVQALEYFTTTYAESTDANTKSAMLTTLLDTVDDLIRQRQQSTSASTSSHDKSSHDKSCDKSGCDAPQNTVEMNVANPLTNSLAEIQEEKTLRCPYEYLVFSGGGIRGFSFLGALVTLSYKWPTVLTNARGFAGTSIGAFVAFLNVLSLSPFEIDDYMSTVNGNMLHYINFQRFRDIGSWFSSNSSANSSTSAFGSSNVTNGSSTVQSSMSIMTPNALQTPILGAYHYADQKGLFNRCIFNTFGLSGITDDELKQARQIYANKILTRQFSTLTFAELYALTRRELAIVVTNLSTRRMEIHSYKHTPDTLVLSSLMASMSIPLLFPPIQIQGNSYVDGGLVNNFPIAQLWPMEKTLGLCLCSSTNNDLIFEHYLKPMIQQHPNVVKHLQTLKFSKPSPQSSSSHDNANVASDQSTKTESDGKQGQNTDKNETSRKDETDQDPASSFFDQIKSIFKSFQDRDTVDANVGHGKSIGILDELTGFTGIMFDQLQYNNIASLDQQFIKNIVFIDTGACPTFSFSTSTAQKQNLLECGFKSTFLWLRSIASR